MDQVKEYLNLALKYRFWIAVGIAALLPVAGYFAAAGDVDKQRAALESQVDSSYKAVQKYANNTRPVIDVHKKLVDVENNAIKQDIDRSWRKLYKRQAPYLTWPDEPLVQETIPVWAQKYGRDKWPQEGDRVFEKTYVDEAIRAYIDSYKDYAKEVYSVFNPFDPNTGKGIVAAPPQESLLNLPELDPAKLPTLGQVWAAQEKLWIERTVLEVIASVNAKAQAKTWQEAPIKQIVALDVASDAALDQKSVAEGVATIEPPDILPPGAEAAAKDAAPAVDNLGGDKLGGFAGLGSGGVGGSSGPSDTIKYIKNDANADQVSVAPIYLSVYCQQSAIPNLLVEFQNSPMNIQVLEVSIVKPTPHSVRKPKKGEIIGGGAGMGRGGRGGGRLGGLMEGGYGMGGVDMGSMMGRMGAGGGAGASGGYGQGNMASMMQGRMGSAGGYSAPSIGGGGSRRGSGGNAAEEKKKGVSVREKTQQNFKAERDKNKKDGQKDDAEETEEPVSKISDPYFDVVEVRIYGQARFYKTPPLEEPSKSESQTAEAAAAPAENANAVAPTDGDAQPAPADKAETTKDAAAGGDAPAKDQAKPDNAPQPDGDAAKPDAPKNEPEKAKGEAEAPKDSNDPPKEGGEPPKDDSQPADAPKPGDDGGDK